MFSVELRIILIIMSTYDKVKQWEENMAQQSGQITVGVPEIAQFLNECLEQVPTLKEQHEGIESTVFIEWKSNVESILRRTFGPDSHERAEFQSIHYYPSIFTGDEDTDELSSYYRRGLDTATAQIKSAIRMLTTMGVPASQPVVRKSGTNITVNPTFNQDNHMSQHQSQTQTTTIEQALSTLQDIVDNQLDDDEVEQIRELLEKFKKKPGVWANAQKLLTAGAGFGRDIAVQFIGAVLAAAVLATKQNLIQ